MNDQEVEARNHPFFPQYVEWTIGYGNHPDHNHFDDWFTDWNTFLAGATAMNFSITGEHIGMALARGYCTDRNGPKILDPDLIMDMTEEVMKHIRKGLNFLDLEAK